MEYHHILASICFLRCNKQQLSFGLCCNSLNADCSSISAFQTCNAILQGFSWTSVLSLMISRQFISSSLYCACLSWMSKVNSYRHLTTGWYVLALITWSDYKYEVIVKKIKIFIVSIDFFCRMGKVPPIKLREVVYTLSPFETTVMGGLWKDLPQKLTRKVSEASCQLYQKQLVVNQTKFSWTLWKAKEWGGVWLGPLCNLDGCDNVWQDSHTYLIASYKWWLPHISRTLDTVVQSFLYSDCTYFEVLFSHFSVWFNVILSFSLRITVVLSIWIEIVCLCETKRQQTTLSTRVFNL